MENFNVGAVVFALLIGVWLVYAMPNIAERRRILGEAEKISVQRHSSSARDLTLAARHHSRQREVEPMRENRQILRPADPTSRPRFELPQSEPDLGAQVIAPAPRMNRVLTAILLGLVVTTVALLVLSAIQVTSVWAPVLSCGALFVYIAGLRATKEGRQEKAVRASRALAELDEESNSSLEEQEDDVATADAATVSETRVMPEPGPVSRAVTNPAERHEAFLRQVLESREHGEGAELAFAEHSGKATFRYGALSSQAELEDPTLEEQEALEETHTEFAGRERQVIGSGLTVDEILQRRRA